MKQTVLAISLCYLSSATAAEPEAVAAKKAAPAQPLRARLTEDVIKEAVRETLAQNPVRRETSPGGQVLSGDTFQAFSRDFTESKKPSCLGPDATKFQPANVSTKDWAFSASGLFVLPFWVSAMVQGKCN